MYLGTEKRRDLLQDAYRCAANWSDDPATQNGAVLLNRDGKVIGEGANRFPNGIALLPARQERPAKYAWLEHAERDAIFDAVRNGESPNGGTLIVPWFACTDCAKAIIGAGIRLVIGHKQMFDRTPPRWRESVDIGLAMLREARVRTVLFDGNIGEVKVLFDGEYWTP